MIIKLRKRTIFICGIIFLFSVTSILIISIMFNSPENIFAGGKISLAYKNILETAPVSNMEEENLSERFQRPSKEMPLENPYSMSDFQTGNQNPPLTKKTFDNPENLILAYYGILREASNMMGYSGGCGTIGMANLPYPYAYELLSNEKRAEIPLKKFINSFKGIGYMTLLKLSPLYVPPKAPPDIKYYMVEIEIITGPKAKKENDYCNGSYFAYYCGLITTEKMPADGWKIKNIDYIPEDFLCAPWHGWSYLADAMVQIVYADNLKIIDKIDNTEQKGSMIYVYASKNQNRYRFDFIRLTNGYDVLIHENVFENGIWKETSLLTEQWKHLKLSG